VHWDVNHMGRGLRTAQITLIICYQIELERLNIYETLTCSIPKTFCRLWMSSASSCLDISLSLSFLHCIVGCARGTSGRGSGGTIMPSGITTTVYKPVAQGKLAIN
jgi:hypothetical protein